MLAETLTRLAVRVCDPAYDPRHAVLDVAPEFLTLQDAAGELPPHLAAELRDLVAEIRSVQPAYPSRRNTSPLFDRAGLGRIGVERAERLVRRIAAVAKSAEKATRAKLCHRSADGGTRDTSGGL